MELLNLFNNKYLFINDEHRLACLVLFEFLETAMSFKGFCKGRERGGADGLICFKKEFPNRLSASSVAIFRGGVDYHFQSPEDIPKHYLNMEELYYYMQLAYFETKKDGADQEEQEEYRSGLAILHKDCEIKDLYADKIREYYGDYYVPNENEEGLDEQQGS